jgi:hypothetical protein
LEELIEWASAALETSFNQPMLPCAIIALNASETSRDSDLWDIDIATTRLLETLSSTVHQNANFKRHAQTWAKKGRKIESVEDLVRTYYRNIRVIRIPSGSHSQLVHQQAKKLYGEISKECATARTKKSEMRMLLDAEDMHAYLQCAFDHFSQTLRVPFDFVQASFFNNSSGTDLGDHILKLACNLVRVDKPKNPKSVFDRLSYVVASCIMLDSIRHHILGTLRYHLVKWRDPPLIGYPRM